MEGFPLQRDPAAVSPPPDEAAWQREIAEARQGHRAKVGTKAAAYYLGIHDKTLLDWVREGRGPEAVKNPSRTGTSGANQRYGFTLKALDAFVQVRTGDVITRGKRTDAETARRESERVQAAIELKAAEDRLAKARARAHRLGMVCFQSLADAVEVQPWARVDGRIVGHAWAVDDATFDAAGDDLVEATLEEALSLPWRDAGSRASYDRALARVLHSASAKLDVARERQEADDLNQQLPLGVDAKGGVCDRCGAPIHPGRGCRL